MMSIEPYCFKFSLLNRKQYKVNTVKLKVHMVNTSQKLNNQL